MIVGGALFVVAVAAVLLLRLGIGGNVLHGGTATITDAFQNLFGSGTYDINSDDETIVDGENASDTALVAPTSSDDSSSSDEHADFLSTATGSVVKKSTKKVAATKKSTTSSAKTNAHASDTVVIPPNNSSTPTVVIAPTATTTATEQTASSTLTAQNNSSAQCAFPAGLFLSSSSSSTTSSAAALTRKIILNEIAWMGSPASSGETAAAAANDEWIELKNISSENINLGGWSILNSSGGIAIRFSSTSSVSYSIPAGGLLLLARGTGGAVSLVAEKIYSGGLSNTGDELAVLDPQCNVSDILNAASGWPGGNNTTKQTLERAADHASWQTSIPSGGTPGAENSLGLSVLPLPTQPTSTPGSAGGGGGGGGGSSGNSNSGSGNASSTDSGSASSTDSGTGGSVATSTPSSTVVCPASHVVIAQIQIAGASTANDFVKLYNPTADAIDMSGWKLRKKSSGGTDASLKVLGKGSVIGSAASFTWANSANGFAASLGADVSSTETIAADNSVALMNASGTIVDEVAWGTGANQYVEGSAFSTNPSANQVLARVSENGIMNDSDDNATDFALH